MDLRACVQFVAAGYSVCGVRFGLGKSIFGSMALLLIRLSGAHKIPKLARVVSGSAQCRNSGDFLEREDGVHFEPFHRQCKVV